MARQARLFVPDCPTLIALQGFAGQVVFPSREAFALFHARLPLSAQQEGVQIHAYGLSAGVALLLITATQARQVGRFVQNLNRHFTPALKNLLNTSTPGIWAPRFKSTEIQPGVRSLKACWYVESMAARFEPMQHLARYPWSSFAVHVGVVHEPWVCDLPSYWQLGNTPFERQVKYKEFSERLHTAETFQNLDLCLDRGWLWGDPTFCEAAGLSANRPVAPRKRGRPVKA